jgi:predicted molibdopterin-dependent oxidoreductase YjgC
MYKLVTSPIPENCVTFTFEGACVSAQRGMSVAAALLCNGIVEVRNTPVSGSSRGPFCMMGTCYDCLVSIDGVTVQACQTIVVEGLEVSRVVVDDEGAS